MTDPTTDPDRIDGTAWGSWADADRLRREAFLRRTYAQRLAWLTEALELAYAFGALAPPVPRDLLSEGGPRPAADTPPEAAD